MHHKLTTAITFSTITSDAAIYVHKQTNNIVILAIHVDNVMSFRNSVAGLWDAHLQLHKIFDLTEEDPNWIMGFKPVEDWAEHTILIDHSPYIDAILCQFNMLECDPIDTPMDTNRTLSKLDGPVNNAEKQAMSEHPYWELIGTPIWISVTSCPHISFVAMHLVKFNVNPGDAHWRTKKWAGRYLKGTQHQQLTLVLGLGNATEPVLYTELDWGCDEDNYCSMSGYVTFPGDSAFSWCSKQQPTVTRSSTEGEYMAHSLTGWQRLWLPHVLYGLGLNLLDLPTSIFIDNWGAIDLSKDNWHHQQTKHIDIQHHFIQECVDNNTFDITHILGNYNLQEIQQ